MTLDERLDALGALWSLWAGHGRAMTDEQWRLPTRLGDWDVRSLYAHAGGWPVGLTRLVDRVRDAAPTHASAAALLCDFNAPDGVANTTAVLVAMAPPVDLIEAATGRGAARVFPVLS
jgi:hypothetical protein